jgi:hypothetical protein
VELKKQELAQKAQNDQMDAQGDQSRLALDQQKEQNDVANDQARLANQQQLAAQRNELTMLQMQQKGN